MSMKVMYVSGKYRDSRGPWYVKKNIDRAADAAMELWKMGFCVICPHQNTYFFEGPIDDPVIIAGDCELVRRSDGVAIIPGWETSQGTRIEFDTAQQANKPVFFFDRHKEAMRRWLSHDYNIENHMAVQKAAKSIEALSKVEQSSLIP